MERLLQNSAVPAGLGSNLAFDARGQQFFYLPAMAFTVVLFTNVFVVVAAVQATKGPADDSVPKMDATLTAVAAAEPEATV